MRSGAGGGSWPSSSSSCGAGAGRSAPAARPPQALAAAVSRSISSTCVPISAPGVPLLPGASTSALQRLARRWVSKAVCWAGSSSPSWRSSTPGRARSPSSRAAPTATLQLGDESENLVEASRLMRSWDLCSRISVKVTETLPRGSARPRPRARGRRGRHSLPAGGSGYPGRAHSRCAAPRPNVDRRSPLRRAQSVMLASAYIPPSRVIRRWGRKYTGILRPASMGRQGLEQDRVSLNQADPVILLYLNVLIHLSSRFGLRRSGAREPRPWPRSRSTGVCAMAGGTSPAAGA